ncbi:MAG: PrsW family glutamic-type intramembrane protease, partial [Vicinamibacterales bacterium]
ILALLVAVSGGALGIIGAIIQEFQASPAFLLGPFVAAPIIEEAMKPVGVYIALIRWPLALRSQTFTAVLAALAGLVFGIIESIVYVTIYVDDPSDTFVAYRFSVTLGLHAAASYLVGLGINQGVLDWAQGRSPLPRASRNFYFAGVILQSLYNTTVVILAISGITDFD